MVVGLLVPALLGIVVAFAGQEPPELVTPRGGTLSLPAGPVAELLERLEPGATPARIPGAPWPDWLDRSAQGWGSELPWRRWVELVRAEAGSEVPDPARRAQLALLARLQGRDGDAWRHFLACAADPALVAALLPLFIPGVPAANLDSSEALPEGTLLAPALPPAPEDPGESLRSLVGRSFEQHSVLVGGAQLSLKVVCEQDGIEVTLAHVAGPRVRVRVIPPCPSGVEPAQLLADWERLPRNDVPVELVLGPEDPEATLHDRPGDREQDYVFVPEPPEYTLHEAREHTLWLTFRRREARWPAPLPASLSRLQPGRTLIVSSPGGNEPHLARFAEALSELFDLGAELRGPDPQPESLVFEPIVLHLDLGELGPESRSAERKLTSLIGLAETLGLERGRR